MNIPTQKGILAVDSIKTSKPHSGLYGEEGSLRVEHAAFDHIEVGAKLIIVGITPGAQQRDLANTAYGLAVRQGRTDSEASRTAKFAASFGGSMRANLVRMLDHVGTARTLNIESFSQAFNPALCGQVHFTSALRYPTFIEGQNYNGQPNMLGSPLLRTMIETLLADEMRALPMAIVQPLGDKPLVALRHLVRLGLLDPARIAPPLPHPSGANAERIAYFLGNKPADLLSAKTDAAKFDGLRASLMSFYLDQKLAA